MNIKSKNNVTRLKKSMLTILISFGVFSTSSCKDKLVVEHEIKVEVTPIKEASMTPKELAKHNSKTQFTVTKSEIMTDQEKLDFAEQLGKSYSQKEIDSKKETAKP